MSVPVLILDGFFLHGRKISSKTSDLKWAYSGEDIHGSRIFDLNEFISFYISVNF